MTFEVHHNSFLNSLDFVVGTNVSMESLDACVGVETIGLEADLKEDKKNRKRELQHTQISRTAKMARSPAKVFPVKVVPLRSLARLSKWFLRPFAKNSSIAAVRSAAPWALANPLKISSDSWINCSLNPNSASVEPSRWAFRARKRTMARDWPIVRPSLVFKTGLKMLTRLKSRGRTYNCPKGVSDLKAGQFGCLFHSKFKPPTEATKAGMYARAKRGK